jgi:Leucine-rich repeat (LRR) protein
MKRVLYFSLAVLITVTSSLPVYVVPANAQAVNEFSCAYVTEIPEIECKALVALYNSTNGPGWLNHGNWLVTNIPSDWFGVTVWAGHIYAISFSMYGLYKMGNNLSGRIPSELGNLTSLITLDLSDNKLTGSIPSEIGNMTSLLNLWLQGNRLEGDVPSSFVNLVNLNNPGQNYDYGLAMDYNYLNVPVDYPDPANPLHVFLNQKDPDWHLTQMEPFSDCSSVVEIPQIECEALVAFYNSTNGPGWSNDTNWLETNRPSSWFGLGVESGHVMSMNYSFRMELGNGLSGSLPPELGNLTYLTYINLANNGLSGSIPPELGKLTNLVSLSLYKNSISGNIPPELGNLTSLQWLVIYGTQLTGSIPPEMGGLTSLTHMILFGNQLSGSIPPDIGNLANLEYLNLTMNQLSGSIPHQLGNLSSLTRLLLYDNHLSGSIPPELHNINYLNEIWLYNNQLSGNIPPELGYLAQLAYLDLSNNRLSGSIPLELGNLVSLRTLHLESNQLTGSIPHDLSNLTNLSSLYLNNNQLSGNIPPELGNLTNLSLLYLNNNQLSGNIPPELGNLINLGLLCLNNNQLTGSLPLELGNLTSLDWLRLNDNQLSGSIPTEIGNLINLEMLWLQDNLLEGDIPASFTNLVNLNYSNPGMPPYSLDMDSNLLNVPPGYPDPGNPLQVFLYERDPDWQLYQGFEQMISSVGGDLTSLDGKTDIHIPAGALITDTTIALVPLPVPHHSPGLLASAHNSFKLLAKDTGGNPVTTFSLPVTVTLTYTDADIFSIPEDTLKLYYWDESGSTWADAVTTCPGEYTRDPSENKLALPLCHLTDFGLFGTPLRIFMPVITH